MSRSFTGENPARTVTSRLDQYPEPRFRQVMESAVRRLHVFVKQVEPTKEEWCHAAGFETVVTHIFVRGDPCIESDAAFGVKESRFCLSCASRTATRSVRPAWTRRWTVEREFTLAATGQTAAFRETLDHPPELRDNGTLRHRRAQVGPVPFSAGQIVAA